jgi:hypothetical protein
LACVAVLVAAVVAAWSVDADANAPEATTNPPAPPAMATAATAAPTRCRVLDRKRMMDDNLLAAAAMLAVTIQLGLSL